MNKNLEQATTNIRKKKKFKFSSNDYDVTPRFK